MQLTPEAARVLGCLVEKARTTPDQYPLSLNALVTGCNQTTNRWPVVRYDERTVEAALDELRVLELVRREKPLGGRAIKYSERIGPVLRLDEAGIALLGVLLLRGPQTPGELKSRAERLHSFTDLTAVDAGLQALADHEDGPFVAQLPREPGRKESRWCAHTGADADLAVDRSGDVAARVASVTPAADGSPDLASRVARLEAEVADLRTRVDGLTRGAEH